MIIALFFFFTPQNKSGGGTGDLGTINGKKVTPQAYAQALNEFKLSYLFHYGKWPNANITQADMDREAYNRLFLIQKASDLGIHVGIKETAAEANQMLHSLGREGQTITPQAFAQQILQPQNMTLADFENFVHHYLVIQQLAQAVGTSGTFVTPQEAAAVYRREHQELATQIVFFSATNYLASIKLKPDDVAKFYTNYLAEYRLPDRVQISYVAFELTNFQAQAKAQLAKTNLDEQVDAIYFQYGAKAFPDAKTPAAAKAIIREKLIDQQARMDASAQANDFASTLFAMDPVHAENLATLAKQKGLTVHVTHPFSADAGPQEFDAPEGFAKTAFSLTPDEPFANPILGQDAVYVIALAGQLPSEIPPLAAIRARVTQDCEMQQATALAQAAGTNFSAKLTVGMAAGKKFAAVCAANDLHPETLPPFSLTTRELPALSDRAELNQVKQVAFTAEIDQASKFEPTSDGGFILYVQSQLPIDQAVMNTDLPQFTANLRRSRESEAFDEWFNQAFGTWLQREAGKSLSKEILNSTE
jgi:hypothetical protein